MKSETDLIEVGNTFPSRDGTDLHLRYIGYADGRPFIVNIQFDGQQGTIGSEIEPSKRAVLLLKIFGLIIRRVAKQPLTKLN